MGEGLLVGCHCDQWAEGMAGGLKKEKGKSGTWFLAIPLHGLHSVWSSCYHLICEKFVIKESGGEAEKQNTKGQIKKKVEEKERGKRKRMRRRERENANKATNSCWPKMVHYQDSLYYPRIPRLKKFIPFFSCFVTPLPFKVNVLIYLEEELSALCKATFTEELLLKS